MPGFHPNLDGAIEEAINIEREIEVSNQENIEPKILHISPDVKCFLCEGKHTLRSCPDIADFKKYVAEAKK